VEAELESSKIKQEIKQRNLQSYDTPTSVSMEKTTKQMQRISRKL